MSSSTISNSDDEECESPKKHLPRPSNDFYSHFECPICLEYFVPPIVRCPNDHNFCITCVQRSALGSSGLKCSLCRQLIDLENVNRNLQDQMSQLFIPCKWKGCGKQVVLSRRSVHHNCCRFSEEQTDCYYSLPPFGDCVWTGTPTELVTHLVSVHSLTTIQREDCFKFLWDIPLNSKERIRPRILEIKYPSNGKKTSLFVLEHYFTPVSNMLLFLIRSLDSDTKLQYAFTLHSKKDSDYFTSFGRRTLNFKSPQLTDFPNCDIEGFICIPYRTIEEIKHQQEGIDYFSFSIAFSIGMEN